MTTTANVSKHMSLAINLIVGFESGGVSYYEQRASRPHWPGGRSGVTIGFGFDIGYTSLHRLNQAWSGFLMTGVLRRLERAVGVRGEPAHMLLPALVDIDIPWQMADRQFRERMLPEWIETTRALFPGSDRLPADAFGALVSLVYNRGTAMDGKRREEMRAIRTAIMAGHPEDVPGHLRAMKRLWPGPETASNLLGRREAEASLFARALAEQQPPLPRPKPAAPAA